MARSTKTQDGSAAALDRIAEEAPKKASAQPQTSPGRGPMAHTELFGFSGTAVLRWMGKKGGFTPETADKALRSQKVELNPATIKIQLKAGENGQRGDPAALNKEQEKILMAFQEKAPKAEKPAKEKAKAKK